MKPKENSPYHIHTLHKGLRLVAAPLKERKSISIGIWVSVGGRDESPKNSGISHFLEHLVFKGTATRTANQIKESVEGVGGSLNAFTSEEHTCFLAKTSSKHFEGVFDVLADMVLNASLKDEDIQKERPVIIEEIKMTQDQPSQLAEELLAEILWPGHALGRSLAGTAETVSGLTQKDLENYRNYYYEPSLVTVVAAGDITEDRLLREAEACFKNVSREKAVKKIDLFQRDGAKPAVKLFAKETEQMHVALGLPALPKGHPDQYVLDILSILLGGNMSSRLFNEVREERGLAYDIGSSLRSYEETGAFVVSAGVDQLKFEQALEVILRELEKTGQELVREDELRRAKEFYLGQLDLGLENTMNHMLWVGESIVSLGRCKTQAEVSHEVEKITREDLKRIAHSLFQTSALNLAVVGAFSPGQEERILKRLAFAKA